MKNKTNKLALFGDPVNHSLSPQIHRLFANQFDLEIDYQLIQVNANDFSTAVEDFFNDSGIGANVTLPHKIRAMSVIDHISDNGKKAKAVNTLFKNDERLLCGDNTDGLGFVNDIKNRLGFCFENKSILILGAGGATQGIVPSILQQCPDRVVIANRSLEKAQAICKAKNTKAIDFEELVSYHQNFDLIIHASSLSHQGKTLKFESHHLHENTMAYDLSYGEAALPFIQHCQSLNIKHISDGLGMLIEQAALSFSLWFGYKPKTDVVFQSLK